MPKKFKKTATATPQDYDYASLSFFSGDKDRLIEALNKTSHQYESLSHFIRAAINMQLEVEQIELQIREK